MRGSEAQEDQILRLLQSHGAAWTPAPELSRIALQYCRALNTLRKRGYLIENKVETHGKVKHGFYRLVGKRNFSENENVNSADMANTTGNENGDLFSPAEVRNFNYPD